MELLHFYISTGHNFLGHHGKPPSEHPMVEVERLDCVAGSGVRGDRYFGYKENYKGQITFFADEVYSALCAQFGINDKPSSVFRRNVITRGIDLGSLIGAEFGIQGARFYGVEECKPCYWMDRAFCEGAEAALEGRGGLRARILTSGLIETTALRIQPLSVPVS
ncbi:MAG: molybdenum cofactor biosysynthesis protein [Verrucomicrobia bacterium]|nr:molybdenum cofactor biosysynthesis protein [Verrucomicrobiota bacterium]